MRTVYCGVLLGLLGSSGAWAASCTLGKSPEQVLVTVPPLTVQRDLPVGTVIWQQTVNAPDPLAGGVCGDASESRLNLVGSDSGQKSGRNPVYSTGIAGIGYAVSTGPDFSDGWPTVGNSAQGVTAYSLRWVVTGPVSSGTLDGGDYARRVVEGHVVQRISLAHPVSVTRLACELNSGRDVVVPMGTLARNGFSGVGSIQGERTFQLGLNCDAGTQVNIQFDGEADSSGAPGVLALLTPGGSVSASGIGVQLLYHQTPLTLGERLPLETASAGIRTYPFTVRYYQTQPQVTSGEANAVATFNLTYQ